MKKKGLSNPAVIASVLSSPQGQQATQKAVDTGFTVLKFLLAGGVLAIILYFIERKNISKK